MKKLLLILTVFISLKVSGQINAVNDTTRITASPTFSAQFVPNIFNSGGVNYRVTYVYNPSTQKYDAVVYSKYLRRFYIAKADSSSNYISPWQFNHGNNTTTGTWSFNGPNTYFNGQLFANSYVLFSGGGNFDINKPIEISVGKSLLFANVDVSTTSPTNNSNLTYRSGGGLTLKTENGGNTTSFYGDNIYDNSGFRYAKKTDITADSTYNAATYVPVTRQIINGYAITGGGTLGTDRTLAVDSTLQASKTYVQNYTSGFARLNGTGFVKASGTAISYDNTSYLPITGGTLTGTLSSGSTISSTSTVRAGNIALTTIPSLGASVGFTPMMGSASSSAGIVGVEVYTQDGTNNRRAGLVMNQTDNVWGLGYASSSGSSPFVIKSGSTEWLRISTAGAVQLDQYTTPGILTNDASGNIISTTVATANIANNAVTYAKMQAMTTNKLLGSGSGTAVAEITLGNGLSFSGTTLNASRSHTIFTPTTGGTVTLVNNQENIINPAGSLVAVTLALPSSPSNNDKVDITFTQSVTTINYSGGTVVGGLTTIAQGGQYHLTYDSGTTTWY